VFNDDEPWFVGKDVAKILGYANTKDALLKHVDDEDKLGSQITTSGQKRNMVVVNESGSYNVPIPKILFS
jgi:anti-repressor protein